MCQPVYKIPADSNLWQKTSIPYILSSEVKSLPNRQVFVFYMYMVLDTIMQHKSLETTIMDP